MKRKLLGYLLGGVFVTFFGFGLLGGNYVRAEDDGGTKKTSNCISKADCKGIYLNTCFPIVGNCIGTAEGSSTTVNPTNAFPAMVGALTKLIMALILVVCFILIIVAGIMRAGAGEDSSKTKKAKDLIKKVAITILLLGFSGAILRLINPNFFS